MQTNTIFPTSTQNINFIPTDLRLPRTLSHPEHSHVYERGLACANVGRSFTPEDNKEFARLENRLDRYDRLDSLGAPDQIIDKEAELILRSTIEVERKMREVAGQDWTLEDMWMPSVEIDDVSLNTYYQEAIRTVNMAIVFHCDANPFIEALEEKLMRFEALVNETDDEDIQIEALMDLAKEYDFFGEVLGRL